MILETKGDHVHKSSPFSEGYNNCNTCTGQQISREQELKANRTKWVIDESEIVVGHFNISLPITYKKEARMHMLHNTVITWPFLFFHSVITEYTFKKLDTEHFLDVLCTEPWKKSQ